MRKLLDQATSTLRALNVELVDEDAEAVALPDDSLERATGGVAKSSEAAE